MLLGNAHIVLGTPDSEAAVVQRLEQLGFRMRANPDVFIRSYPGFGADDARALITRSSLRAVGSDSRIFIVATPGMTSEAQNALLKTIEEPLGNALFIFIVPSPATLLPTFRSRCQMLDIQGGKAKDALDGNAFLRATKEARIDMLKPLLEKDDDDKRDLGAILSFLASLEETLSRTPHGKKETALGLRALYRTRKYATDKGALVKPLLEHMALLMPRI